MFLGLDDTDAPQGGCTTWVLSEVLRELRRDGAFDGTDLVGPPRLVRLNPGVPWKTRGNAALAARFGRGRGASRIIGRVPEGPLRAYPAGRPLSAEQSDRLWELALRVLRRASRWGEEGTDPTALLAARPLEPELYWRAVREEVPLGWVLDRLAMRQDVRLAAYGSGQGAVGAAAAVAWPGRKRTWEAIAYREAASWGRPRRVDAALVARVARGYPESFLSVDPSTRRVMIAPHTPCPILLGVRGTRVERMGRLLQALLPGAGEPPERWVLFQTNQASGDHLLSRRAAEAPPGTSGIFLGRVRATPEVLRGGHVRWSVEDASGILDCMAFEPTRTLPRVARELRAGDQVRVWGSVPWRGRPGTLHVEGVQVLRAPPAWEREGNPACQVCGVRMGSWGRGKGFRCPRCRAKTPLERAPGRLRSRSYLLGTYLPTPSARRHLAPLGAPRRARAPSLYTPRRPYARRDGNGRPA